MMKRLGEGGGFIEVAVRAVRGEVKDLKRLGGLTEVWLLASDQRLFHGAALLFKPEIPAVA